VSEHTINRITNVLETQYKNAVDISDLEGRPQDQVRVHFLSRALAALCVKNYANVDVTTAGGSVTDAYHDNGIDAIYFDQKADALLLVQSKWSGNGNRPLDGDAAGTFVAGIRDLLAARFDRFNEKVNAKKAEVMEVLYAARPVRLRFITCHTASQPTPLYVRRKVEDLVEELNDPVPVARADYLDQAGVYGLITADSKPPKISLQIGLSDWGEIEKPFLAYYGRVHVREVAQWWNDHGNGLFTQNLRLFYYSSDVNEAISATLSQSRESFWYFNNGITIICDTVSRGLAGAPGRAVGVFTCEGVSIVNGAQTVGTIGSVLGSAQSDQEAWVQVRIISLERCPPEFGRLITRAANLQNAVGNREFAAIDPLQHRLATDFALDKRKYVYKSGEMDPKGDEGCSIVEATQALASANSVALAVQVKREIGAIWADTNTQPYTDVFNDKLTSSQMWRAVLIMRAVDDELQKLRGSEAPRADMVGVHMNRLILHLVFKQPGVREFRREDLTDSEVVNSARTAVVPIFGQVARYLELEHPGEYYASLCKNLSKCEKLAESYTTPSPVQGSLFG
jgi:hypothetical protein